MKFSSLIIITVLLCLSTKIFAARSKIITLTDDNWKQCLTGEWMIKFYAPWCPACQANEPQFRDFSEWSDDLNIKVGVVDITKEPGLSGRFMVTALPTFYHGRDGEFRRYNSDRSASAMEEYIETKGWQAHEPISWLRHPDSIQMTVMSFLFKTSVVMKTIHETLTEKYGLSTWVSYTVFALGTLVTGLTLGLILVCVVDFIYPPKQKPRSRPVRKDAEKEEKDLKEEEEKEEKAEQSGDENETEVDTDDAENTEPNTQKSQDWETIQDAEVEASQVRKRHVDKEITGEAGDAKTTE